MIAGRMKIEALALVSVSCLAGCGIQPPPNIRPQEANVAALNSQDWRTHYGDKMSFHPPPIPTEDGHSIFQAGRMAGKSIMCKRRSTRRRSFTTREQTRRNTL